MARSLGTRNVLLKNNSKLVIGQINSEYEAKESRMKWYLKLTNQIIGELEQVSFMQVPQSHASSEDGISLLDLKLEIR